MSHFMLYWNPKKYTFERYDEIVELTKHGHSVEYTWSTGTNKQMVPGDQFFLYQNGDSGGIVGHGNIVSNAFETDHWSGDPDKTSTMVNLEFTELVQQPQRLSTETLEDEAPEFQWRGRMNCQRLPEEVEEKVLALWQDLCS
jgi:predicted RNA-binding protein with PUA-like domain